MRIFSNMFRNNDNNLPKKEETSTDIQGNVIADSINRIKSLEKEITILKEQQKQIEDRLVSLFDEISDAKTTLFQHLQQFDKEEAELIITKEELSKDCKDDDSTTIIPPVIKPKNLEIKGYEYLFTVLRKNAISLLTEGFEDLKCSSFPFTLAELGCAMSQCGKELILIKHSNTSRTQKEIKEAKDILETCRKILAIKQSGDINGYNKYTNFLYEKYPMPADPFLDENPVDYFPNLEYSIYKNTFHLLYFVNKHRNGYLMFNTNVHRLFRNEEDIPNAVELSKVFINLFDALLEIAKKGYELAIIPIFDENILYRPQSAAQDDSCFSLMYYDEYVENPRIIDGDEAERSRRVFSYSGSTYVSGHYRQGHFRNGRWVSGGFVRGHYRL